MDGDPVDRVGGIEPGAERCGEIVLDALGRHTDDDDPAANKCGRLLAVHDVGDAFERKRLRAAPIIHQQLIAAAVDPNVGPARLVERRDDRLAEQQALVGPRLQSDPLGC